MHPSVSYYSNIFIPTSFHSFDNFNNFQTKYLSGHVQQCTLVTSPLTAASSTKAEYIASAYFTYFNLFLCLFI
jgi:hypothetical protein